MLKPGNSVSIHAYKHNENLYRVWERAVVYSEDDNLLILINESVTVTEINGRKWKTNEPAVWFFFKKEWFNVIAMFKNKGLNFYCNLASPYIVEEDTIKYVDYDLDIKVFNDNSYKILDLKEFNRNRLNWKYSRDVIELIWEGVDKLKKKIHSKEGIFDHDYVKSIWNEFNNK